MEIFIEENNLYFEVNNSDTKIRIEVFNKIVYPDAVLVCAGSGYFKGREEAFINSALIVEELFPSTQLHDRTTKFEMYRLIETFKEYVLIYQDLLRVAAWTMQTDGAWLP